MIDRETPVVEIVGQMSLSKSTDQMSLSKSTDVSTQSWVFISVKNMIFVLVLVLPIGNQDIADEETCTVPRNACKQKYEGLLANMKKTGIINMIKMSAAKTIIRSYCKQPKRQTSSYI